MQRKALAYLAVNGLPGLDEGTELKRQRRRVREAARGQSFSISRFYEEDRADAIQHPTTRPAFRALIEELFTYCHECIVVESLERFDRTWEIQEAVQGFLEISGFEVITCSGQQTLDNTTGRSEARAAINAYAQCDKDFLALRLGAARKRSRRVVGAKPYGFYPGENAIFATMQDLRKQGLGYDRIAGVLNQERVPSRRNGLWYGTTINKILNRS